MTPQVKIINAEHGVASCRKEDIPLCILKQCNAEKVNIFYIHQIDALVLNEENKNFDKLKDITLLYLEADDKSRSAICNEAIRIGMDYFVFLNKIIRIRRKMYNKRRWIKTA